jgi:hypothetical protein
VSYCIKNVKNGATHAVTEKAVPSIVGGANKERGTKVELKYTSEMIYDHFD